MIYSFHFVFPVVFQTRRNSPRLILRFHSGKKSSMDVTHPLLFRRFAIDLPLSPIHLWTFLFDGGEILLSDSSSRRSRGHQSFTSDASAAFFPPLISKLRFHPQSLSLTTKYVKNKMFMAKIHNFISIPWSSDKDKCHRCVLKMWSSYCSSFDPGGGDQSILHRFRSDGGAGSILPQFSEWCHFPETSGFNDHRNQHLMTFYSSKLWMHRKFGL